MKPSRIGEGGFGTLPEEEAAELRRVVAGSRAGLGEGLAARQEQYTESMAGEDASDETS